MARSAAKVRSISATRQPIDRNRTDDYASVSSGSAVDSLPLSRSSLAAPSIGNHTVGYNPCGPHPADGDQSYESKAINAATFCRPCTPGFV